jgi:hypothetical protein
MEKTDNFEKNSIFLKKNEKNMRKNRNFWEKNQLMKKVRYFGKLEKMSDFCEKKFNFLGKYFLRKKNLRTNLIFLSKNLIFWE